MFIKNTFSICSVFIDRYCCCVIKRALEALLTKSVQNVQHALLIPHWGYRQSSSEGVEILVKALLHSEHFESAMLSVPLFIMKLLHLMDTFSSWCFS